jgi:hypothetical protein
MLLRVDRAVQHHHAYIAYWHAAFVRQDKRHLERVLSLSAADVQLGPCCSLLSPLASARGAWQRLLCSLPLPLPLPHDYCPI